MKSKLNIQKIVERLDELIEEIEGFAPKDGSLSDQALRYLNMAFICLENEYKLDNARNKL